MRIRGIGTPREVWDIEIREPGGWLCIRARIRPCRNISVAKGFSR
jgi:hypothetical protein